MSFASLSEAWMMGDTATRAASRIEYRSATGPLIAPGTTLCDATTLIQGDGKLFFRRRGDFGEREDFRPGSWSSSCDPSQVESLWSRLAQLGPDSFPARVADPGDTIRYLTAFVHGKVHTLAIGPSDPTVPDPAGDAFMQILHPILRLRESGVCEWSIESAFKGLVLKADGVEAEILFRNPGCRPIGLVFNGDRGSPDFQFRFAQKRDNVPYPEWHQSDSRPSEADNADVVNLDPGSVHTRKVLFPCHFPDSGRYVGKVSYRQIRYLDSLAGIPILAGIAYTEMAGFAV